MKEIPIAEIFERLPKNHQSIELVNDYYAFVGQELKSSRNRMYSKFLREILRLIEKNYIVIEKFEKYI